MKKLILVYFGIIIVILIILGLISAPIFITSIDKHEYGFTFNRFTGEIDSIGRTGWVVRNPIKYAVHKIDERPYQISITAMMGVGGRVLNAKLVRFDHKGLKTFIEWHGRKAGDNISNLLEILKCYAFAADGGKSCPFLKVESEIIPGQTMSSKSEEYESQAKSN